MSQPLAKKTASPDQHQVNCLAAFIETVEALRNEPFFGSADEKSAAPQPDKVPSADAAERIYFRSALISFRRIWDEGELACFSEICKLLNRFEDCELQLEMINARHQQHTERRWANFSLSAGEVVNLWLNSLFGAPVPKGKKRPEWRERIDFDTLAKARGRAFLKSICRTTVSALGPCYFDALKVARQALARWERDYGLLPEFEIGPTAQAHVEIIPEPSIIVLDLAPERAAGETSQQRFDRILSGNLFKGLKAILESLSADRELVRDGVSATNSYQELLSRLGYTITLTKQIHVQDCYSRLGKAGGIRAVIPYHDIPSQSTLSTVVNFDSTVTTTARSAGFFNQMLIDLKTQL